ncbi:hypothetical protein J6590_011869 [Homalodisca vitripennis]|nr:hypothetical protein J6590_011869 [Homalodisca vitripennis]
MGLVRSLLYESSTPHDTDNLMLGSFPTRSWARNTHRQLVFEELETQGHHLAKCQPPRELVEQVSESESSDGSDVDNILRDPSLLDFSSGSEDLFKSGGEFDSDDSRASLTSSQTSNWLSMRHSYIQAILDLYHKMMTSHQPGYWPPTWGRVRCDRSRNLQKSQLIKPVILTAYPAQDRVIRSSENGLEATKPILIDNQLMGGVDCKDKSIYQPLIIRPSNSAFLIHPWTRKPLECLTSASDPEPIRGADPEGDAGPSHRVERLPTNQTRVCGVCGKRANHWFPGCNVGVPYTDCVRTSPALLATYICWQEKKVALITELSKRV